MKKTLHLVLLLTELAFCTNLSASVAIVSPSGHTLYYNISDIYGVASVTRQNNTPPCYTNLIGDLEIPDTIEFNSTRYAVVSIEEHAFKGCSGLTSVTIPNSVTFIDYGAFEGCSGLSQTKYTGTIARWCGIEFITIHTFSTNAYMHSHESNPIYHSHNLYINNIEITDLVIPNSVTSIGSNAFVNCSGLTSVSLPNSVTSIGSDAFLNCSGLTSVSIPNSITSIGSGAFANCSGLTSVAIPNSVTSIGSRAFANCSGLTSIFVQNNPMYDSRNNCNAIIESTTNKLIVGCKNTIIPNSVSSIGEYAFCGCSELISIIIPNSVSSIGEYAFSECCGLISIIIPNSVATIGFYAFNNVRHIEYDGTALGAPWGAISMNGVMDGDFVYTDNTKHFLIAYAGSGGNVTIPSTVDTIGHSAFYKCIGLTSVIIPTSVVSINGWAFFGCTGLTSLIIPNSVTTIEQRVFAQCSGLTSVSIPNSVTSIGSNAFARCRGLTSVTIPNSVTYIGQSAFNQCDNLLNVKIVRCVPAVIEASTFPATSTVTVPCSCFSNYHNNSSWSVYSLKKDGYEYTVNHTMDGSVEIDESEYCNNLITLTATEDEYYHFSHWNDGNTENPRTVTLTQDTSFTAIFEPNSYFISTSSNDSTMGTVNGGGLYDYNTTQTLEAVPAEGHHFIRWTDGNTDNPRNILIEGDTSYTAVFAIDTLTVNVSSNNMVYGTVNGGGTFVYGSPCTIEAEAYSGYVFVRWSNGVTYNPYTFAVLTNMDIEAVFAPEGSIHNVTVQVQPAGTGTVTGGGPYANGETVTLEAIPNDGYHFVRWQDDVTDNPRTIFVTTDMAFTAFFEADDTQGIVDANSNGIQVWAADGSIIIEGYTDEAVHVYDMMGREVASSISKNGTFRMHVRTGVYLVKVGNQPVRKVVVLK